MRGGGEHGVHRLLERPAVVLPVDGKHRDEGLGRTPGPLTTELHRVLFCDYNIIPPPGGALHDPPEASPPIGGMALDRPELHPPPGGPEPPRETARAGKPSRPNHPPPPAHPKPPGRPGRHAP